MFCICIMAYFSSCCFCLELRRVLKMKRKELYDGYEDDFLFQINDEGKPRCMVCHSTLQVYKPANMERHYLTVHNKDFNYLSNDECLKKKAAIKEMYFKQFPKKDIIDFKYAAAKASYVVSFNLANANKPFTDGDFLKQNMTDVLECFGEKGKEFSKHISSLTLSRNTVARKVDEIAAQIVSSLKTKIKSAKYVSICLDESTDCVNTSQLSIFIRSVSEKFEMIEDFLSLVPLHGTTKGIDVYNAVEKVLREFDALAKLCSVCTDGAPAMIGHINGFVGHLKKNGTVVPNYHCAIHQEALCSKSIQLKDTMQTVCNIVNRLKGGHNALTHRKLKSFLEEVEAEHNDVLLYTEVRWLSRGKCLKRFFGLKKEICLFIESAKIAALQEYLEKIKGVKFQMELAFLTDITGILNDLNLKLQIKGQSIFELSSSISGFKKKIVLLKDAISNNNLCHFKSCQIVLNENPNVDFSIYTPEIEKLVQDLDNRFKDFADVFKLAEIFANPFSVVIENQQHSLQFELCDLQEDIFLKSITEKGLDFWKKVPTNKYPILCDEMLKGYATFGSSYLCECCFSIMKRIKTEYRSRLTDHNLENSLRISLHEKNNIDFNKLCET